ncbi:hypothetical protein FB451DRAFT_1200810 [Mycena latifolia]|nr:hypothetical protein FB451DRAFT_1200810 [Mycena latifolia]
MYIVYFESNPPPLSQMANKGARSPSRAVSGYAVAAAASRRTQFGLRITGRYLVLYGCHPFLEARLGLPPLDTGSYTELTIPLCPLRQPASMSHGSVMPAHKQVPLAVHFSARGRAGRGDAGARSACEEYTEASVEVDQHEQGTGLGGTSFCSRARAAGAVWTEN